MAAEPADRADGSSSSGSCSGTRWRASPTSSCTTCSALRRLGYDPYYVEDSGRWVYDPRSTISSPDAAGNVAAVAPVLEAHGFAGRWAFRGNYPGGRCYGMTEAQILRLYREADAFLNVTGAQEIREEHLASRGASTSSPTRSPRR